MRIKLTFFLISLGSLTAHGGEAATGFIGSAAPPRIDPRWKWSLAPVVASQVLDVASSYGMRELNPALAGADGRFGMKAATVKISVTGALLGAEYLIVKIHPRAARVFTKLNWSGSALTAGFAAHNFAIR